MVEELTIACPGCGATPLVLRPSCLSVGLVCLTCRRRFSIGDVAPHLDEASFDRLQRAIEARFSDRV